MAGKCENETGFCISNEQFIHLNAKQSHRQKRKRCKLKTKRKRSFFSYDCNSSCSSSSASSSCNSDVEYGQGSRFIPNNNNNNNNNNNMHQNHGHHFKAKKMKFSNNNNDYDVSHIHLLGALNQNKNNLVHYSSDSENENEIESSLTDDEVNQTRVGFEDSYPESSINTNNINNSNNNNNYLLASETEDSIDFAYEFEEESELSNWVVSNENETNNTNNNDNGNGRIMTLCECFELIDDNIDKQLNEIETEKEENNNYERKTKRFKKSMVEKSGCNNCNNNNPKKTTTNKETNTKNVYKFLRFPWNFTEKICHLYEETRDAMFVKSLFKSARYFNLPKNIIDNIKESLILNQSEMRINAQINPNLIGLDHFHYRNYTNYNNNNNNTNVNKKRHSNSLDLCRIDSKFQVTVIGSYLCEMMDILHEFTQNTIELKHCPKDVLNLIVDLVGNPIVWLRIKPGLSIFQWTAFQSISKKMNWKRNKYRSNNCNNEMNEILQNTTKVKPNKFSLFLLVFFFKVFCVFVFV